MPINIPDSLPAKGVLESENIFVMDHSRAFKQDIRPLKILVVNLMPLKILTETQLMRALSNTPLQVDVDLLCMNSHTPKNTTSEHMLSFYKSFDEVKSVKYDGMIITGAPVEHLEFEEVAYWKELQGIMEWSKTHVTCSMHICWGAQAGLYHHYGIKKNMLDKKLFGVFQHKLINFKEPLLRGFDDQFWCPHSRNTGTNQSDVDKIEGLSSLAISEDAGPAYIISDDRRLVFVTGHPEYDFDTLKKEYNRDIEKGEKIDVPQNYFPNNNPELDPIVKWRSHASLLFTNWLNYYVYQQTPYSL